MFLDVQGGMQNTQPVRQSGANAVSVASASQDCCTCEFRPGQEEIQRERNVC